MGEQLLYKYWPDQILVYDQQINMVLNDPEAGKSAGRAKVRMHLKVLKEHDDGLWTIEFWQDPLKMEGILQSHIPDGFSGGPVVFQMDSHGAIMAIKDGAPFNRIPLLPEHSIEAGESWSSVQGPLRTDFILESFDFRNGSIVANIASTSASESPEEEMSTTTESTMLFSLTDGYQLESTTIIEMKWKNGRTVAMVVENRLAQTT